MEPQYYKERMGFAPPESRERHANGGQALSHYETNVGYEENLSKFKDERDAIQKKTFTKWVNKHLKKCNRSVRDLFFDLRDGKSLLGLLEVLSGERLPSQKGQLRFHQIQNVQVALDFLRYRKIKLVNIRAEDIVDGNPKLTLGLIWTIILHFQVSRQPSDLELLTGRKTASEHISDVTHSPGRTAPSFHPTTDLTTDSIDSSRRRARPDPA
ncbi:alpha-actinin-4-like [Pollicipes pollicipes]|uniref:alpha-actinin-4-like n=1 Tax=Pollicipes pollicipes TaxID=41117 RepID=UPI001884BEFA|nr:alpha-actinin-4-like [Pollicipes pollicipes]